VITVGIFSDVYDKTNLLFFGSVVLAAAFYLFYVSDVFQINLLIMFFIGAGLGSYEGVTDAMLLDVHDRRQSFYISINHFFVTLGSLTITTYLIFLQMNWRRAMTQSGIAVSVIALIYLLSRLEPKGDGDENLLTRLGFLIRERSIIALFVATICAVGIELGTAGILTTYLMQFSAMNQVTSKIGLIVFLGGIASGRLLIGLFSRKEHVPSLIMILFASSILFLSSLFFLNVGRAVYVLIYFSGITISALLPLIITQAGLQYLSRAGTALGIIKFAIPIGGTLIPFLLSLLVKFTSFRTSLVIFPVAGLAGLLMVGLNRRNFVTPD
jgi:predicted MFS family arabinose efflux permease